MLDHVGNRGSLTTPGTGHPDRNHRPSDERVVMVVEPRHTTEMGG
jgi:hypothetical protein